MHYLLEPISWTLHNHSMAYEHFSCFRARRSLHIDCVTHFRGLAGQNNVQKWIPDARISDSRHTTWLSIPISLEFIAERIDNMATGRHLGFQENGDPEDKTNHRNGFLRSKLAILDILHDFLSKLVWKLYGSSFPRWRPAAILDSEVSDHLGRYHLVDFGRQWSKVPIPSEKTSASKNGYGV